MAAKKVAPVHPGEILIEELLEPLGISQYRLSKDIGVAPRRINEIVHGKPCDQPRHGSAAGLLLRHDGDVLVESPDPLRP